MKNIESYLEEYRHKLEDYYSINVAYSQPKNEVKLHYNTICICLKENFTDADFFHELTHLKFITEENIIKYYYPVEQYFEEKDRYVFINSLVNIVYDLYVDSCIAVTYDIEKSYFEKKLKIYDTFLKNIDKALKLKDEYIHVIKRAVEDYRDVLAEIVSGRTDSSCVNEHIAKEHTANENIAKEYIVDEYISNNDIESQRKRITGYLVSEGLENDFEWITHRTIHEREQKKILEEMQA